MLSYDKKKQNSYSSETRTLQTQLSEKKLSCESFIEGVLINILDNVLGYCLFTRGIGFYMAIISLILQVDVGEGEPKHTPGRSTTGQNPLSRAAVCAFICVDIYVLLFLWGWLFDSLYVIPLEIRR